jgi:hypothetical protein
LAGFYWLKIVRQLMRSTVVGSAGWLGFAGRAIVGLFALSYFGALPASANQVVTGTDSGVAGHVKRFTGALSVETASFLPYGGFTGGVRVAAGDVNGDGTPDIVTVAGNSAQGHVKAFSGVDQSELKSFFAYGSASIGTYVAAGDFDSDGLADIVTGADTAATHVKVFSSATGSELQSFLAYPGIDDGVRVAAGDVNGDGVADIITSLGDGFQPHVKVFDGTNLDPLASFFAYGLGYTGGVYVASGDVNGDGNADVITGAGIGGSTHVKVFNGTGPDTLYSFFAYDGVNLEVRVGAGDVDGDGYADIITGLGAGAPSHVKVFSGASGDLMSSYLAYGPSYEGGIYVAGVTPVQRVVVPEGSTIGLLALAGAMGILRGRRRAIA